MATYTGYGSTSIKRAGIANEPIVLQKTIMWLESRGYEVTYRKATEDENKYDKIDYFIFFHNKPFGRYRELPIDVKSGDSYTIIENRTGQNALEKSKAKYIVIITPKRPNKISWISVDKLRQCVKIDDPNPKPSEEKGNTSEYFWLNTYVEKNKNFFGNWAKTYDLK
jgi:hypothetical protein